MRRAAGILLIATVLSACGSGAGTDGSGGSSGASGVRGRVVAGPQCPVVTQDSPCPDEPADGAGIEILRDGVVVETATSDAHGRFEVELEPGTYEVRAVPPSDVGMSAKPVTVRVEEGAFAEVDVLIDTGIR